MAFSSISHSNHQDVDRALENLGFSYLDDVPFSVDPRLAEANVDLSRAEALLARPAPSVSGLSSLDLPKLGRLEKQFLEHLAKLDAEAKAKREREEKEIAEYQEKKQKEDEERERKRKVDEEDKEKQLLEQQQQQQEKEEQQLSEKLEKEVNMNKEEASPKQEFLTPKSSPEESAKMAAFISKPPANFNYSDFEAESDPFERAELQTLDDLRILATVLQTTSPAVPGSTTTPSFATASTAQSTNTTQSGAAMAVHQSGMYFCGHHYYPQVNYQMPQYLAMPYPTSVAHPPPATSWPAHSVATNVAASTLTTSLKSSKSYGDIVAEMKKEDSTSAASSLSGHRDIRKLSSQTPPPRPVPFRQPSSSVTNTALDWIPWPDLDGTDTLKRRGNSPTKGSSCKSEDPSKILEGLSATSAATCRMISDMGFPLSRVVKVCRALGDDQQQIINYCLLVDKFVEGEKFAVEAAEQALLLHTVDENKSRKHLQVFRQLSEFGFESSKIHNALLSCDLEYEKTLENLLK